MAINVLMKEDVSTFEFHSSCQWRRYLWGTGARAPLGFSKFSYYSMCNGQLSRLGLVHLDILIVFNAIRLIIHHTYVQFM